MNFHKLRCRRREEGKPETSKEGGKHREGRRKGKKGGDHKGRKRKEKEGREGGNSEHGFCIFRVTTRNISQEFPKLII